MKRWIWIWINHRQLGTLRYPLWIIWIFSLGQNSTIKRLVRRTALWGIQDTSSETTALINVNTGHRRQCAHSIMTQKTFLYLYVNVCVYIFIYLSISINIECIHKHIYGIYVNICLCIRIYTYIFAYIYTYIYIYIYMWVFTYFMLKTQKLYNLVNSQVVQHIRHVAAIIQGVSVSLFSLLHLALALQHISEVTPCCQVTKAKVNHVEKTHSSKKQKTKQKTSFPQYSKIAYLC